MSGSSQNPKAVWLRMDRPVVPVDISISNHLEAVEDALSRGVLATADASRPGFYEFEVGDSWYYIHIPCRIVGVYLIAAARAEVASLA